MTERTTVTFAGALLTAAGVLVAMLTGLCSLTMLAPSVRAVLHGTAPSSSLTPAFVLVGLFGGVPFMAGVAMVVAGLRLLRERPRESL